MIAVGGYDRTAIGEDMDLTIRLQRHFRARREPVRIAFDPNPLALDAGARGLGCRCGHSATAGAGDCSRRSGDIAG